MNTITENPTLNELSIMVDLLNSTNSKNEKMSILANHPDMQNILLYTYDPYRMFGVTSKSLKKHEHSINFFAENLFDILDLLANRELTGYDAIAAINWYIEANSDYKNLIYNIIDKNLKTRTDVKLINKVYPGLIPTFDVALAHKYEDHSHKINWDLEDWYWSRKLDGVRVIARKENGNVTFYSRKGKEFSTLGLLKSELEHIPEDNFILDGEMCVIDDNGNEDYKSIVSQIKRKNYTIDNLEYVVFDCLTLEEFDTRSSDETLMNRLNNIEDMFDQLPSIYMVSMSLIEDESQVYKLLDEATAQGWEGIMMRKDCAYEGKRTRNLLKVKKMMDAEYKVIGIETGPFRIINKHTGLEDTIETLTNVLIEHKGNVVSVGSGFTLAERNKYYSNPSLIRGAEITVQYFEESVNNKGEFSLRFPVVKFVFELNERDV
jgi:DNA ligase-1